MTETPPKFTINDFPTELIERFVPDRRLATISLLKLVSKRFYHVFSYDLYYKSYLHFPEKHYLCEAKYEKNSGKEIFKDIESGSIGKWMGYLKIENIHLKNWREGKITHTEIRRIGKGAGFIFSRCRQELIDEDSEHWLLNVRNDRAIVLLNITDKPKMLVYPETHRHAHNVVGLLSRQVICLDFMSRRVRVLDIVYDGYVISLQCNLVFDIGADDKLNWEFLSGKCESDGLYKNIFIHGFSGSSGILHFHDLKTGNGLEDICFRDYTYLHSFGDYDKFELSSIDLIPPIKVKFPYIVVTIEGTLNSKTLVIFNVDKMEVTTFFNISDQSLTQYYISGNVAYIFLSIFEEVYIAHVSVHRVSLERSCENMEKPTTPDLLYRFRIMRFTSIIISKHLKFAYKDHRNPNKVHIMSITDSGVSAMEVFLNIGICELYKIVRMIGSDILIVKTAKEPQTIISFKIPKEGGGQCVKVLDWSTVVAENKTPHCFPLKDMTLELVNYSKVVLYYKNTKNVNYLAIIHF